VLGKRFSATRSLVSDVRAMLAIAWRMDARLTLLYYATAFVAALSPLATAWTLKLVVDNVLVAHQAVTVPFAVVAALAAHYALIAVNSAVRFGLHEQYYDYVFRYRLQDELSYRFCDKLTQLDVPHLEDPSVQALITKVRDTHQWRLPELFRVLAYLFIALVGLVTAAIALVSFGWWIVPVVTASTVPRLYLRARMGELRWSMYGSGAPEARKLWYFGWLLSEANVLRELKVFGAAPALLDRYRAIQQRLFALGKQPLDAYRRVAVLAPIVETGVVLAVAATSLGDVTSGDMSLGTFTFVVGMLHQLASFAAETGSNVGQVYESALFARPWRELMALERVIPLAREPRHLPIAPPRIELRDVSFRYPSSQTDVLRGVSFTIEPGENVALVGSNGAGKSTLIKLLCRFYDVGSGEILIDGVPLRELDIANWYAHLGTLFQDFVEYRLTVRDNVLLGDANRAAHDEAALAAAIDKAGAREFVDALPRGVDQILGNEFDDGHELSGGQWQKLAIARAFYRAPPVLIMDEPTSAIDAEAEYEIFTNLEAAYRDKTLILVSHRFSTVRNADRIIVIEDGRVAEQGTHAELLAHGGRYATMFALQAAGYR